VGRSTKCWCGTLSNVGEVTKNDQAWEKLFTKYAILPKVERNGYFEITASQINEFREARLMTKFDHRINLPRLFAEHDLAILPVTRGSYVIARLAAYQKIPQSNPHVQQVVFPEYLESIDYLNITSEATALNCAYVSHMLADFLEESELLPTVNGRMSSNAFSFNILNTVTRADVALTVNNAQLEIDGGYEGTRSLALIEAKNFIAEDFLIRQLYYPFRLWQAKVAKRVRPIFAVYSNGLFSLYEYEFTDSTHYNSLVLVKQKNYSLESVAIGLAEIREVWMRTGAVPEPEIAFPQADSFKRVINLCELLCERAMSRDEITCNYAFDARQTNYYADAGRYLGLIEKRSEQRMPFYYLTERGHHVLKLPYQARQLKFVALILEHLVFRETLRLYLERGAMPVKAEIVTVMRQANLYNIEKDSTYERRASTVSGWVNWILELQR
jgi:hypothetical protein